MIFLLLLHKIDKNTLKIITNLCSIQPFESHNNFYWNQWNYQVNFQGNDLYLKLFLSDQEKIRDKQTKLSVRCISKKFREILLQCWALFNVNKHDLRSLVSQITFLTVTQTALTDLCSYHENRHILAPLTTCHSKKNTVQMPLIGCTAKFFSTCC